MIRYYLVRVLVSILWYSGIIWLYEKVTPTHGHIIELHRIGENSTSFPSNKRLNISEQRLTSFIKHFVKKKYSFITLDDYCAGNYPHNKKFLIFTLDDGYLDNLTHALPIFEKYNIPFTIYLCSGFPDGTSLLWWYDLEYIVKKYDSLEFAFRGTQYTFKTISNKQQKVAFNAICELCLSCNSSDIGLLEEILFSKYMKSEGNISSNISLNWDNIIELSRNPLVTLGCHGVDHISLQNLTEEEIKRDLIESKKRIELKIGKPVIHYSFPFGIFPQSQIKIRDILEYQGFTTAVTSSKGNINTFSREVRYNLPRLTLHSQTEMKEFRAQSSNIFNSLSRLYSIPTLAWRKYLN
jgi:peptidoglycan/xylan/chitin deacetylase (PgdA/CDA1 family)